MLYQHCVFFILYSFNFGVVLHGIITFRVSRRRREMYTGHERLCVCLCDCPHRIPTLLHGPGCNLHGGIVGVPSSCALLGGFAIGARVSLLYDNIVQTRNVSECLTDPDVIVQHVYTRQELLRVFITVSNQVYFSSTLPGLVFPFSLPLSAEKGTFSSGTARTIPCLTS